MAIDPKRVKEIFLEAAELSEESVRVAYLDEACEGDAGLRARVEALLRSHDPEGSFLGTPAAVIPELDDSATQALTGTPDPGVSAVQTTDGENGASDDEALSFLAPPTRPDSLGRIGHYEVLQVLGRGGFGIVFRAFDEMLQRVVALKVMAPQLAATSPARKRFLREARSSAQVRHENVVQVYEVAEQPLPYLAMEFIPGETLQQRLDRVGPLDVPEVLRIGRQIAEGLAAAHAMDLIHRDIKPGNVLLEGGQHKVKITDFGLARTADDASISQSGIIAGTPMYMAPEQALGQTLDQRADLFSLGSVLYQMVAGRPPFRANTAVAVLKRVAEDQPRAIREIIPETPPWLCDIIAKLHAKDPAERYQSAREVADVLADCEAQLKANATLKDFSRIPRPKSTPAGKWKWTAAVIVLLSIIALTAMELAGVTYLFRGQQAKRDPISTSGGPTPTLVGSPEVPRRAADVLPFLAGTWRVEKLEIEPKPPTNKERSVGYITCDYVAGGKFLRQRGAFENGTVEPALQAPLKAGSDVPLILYSYDPGKDVLTHWGAWPNGLAYGPVLGRFDPDSRSLLWLKTFDDGIQSTHQFNFVDANTVTTRLYNQDAGGKIIQELHLTFTRLKGPVTFPNKPTDPNRPKEMKVLDRLVGEWHNEITIRDSAAPGKLEIEKARTKADSILGGRFVESVMTFEPDNHNDYSLTWYDAAAKKYRAWVFIHFGYVHEFTGAWNDATKTLIFNSPDKRLEGRWVFNGDDLFEFVRAAKDKDGKVTWEATSVSRRTTSSAVVPFTDADVQRIAALPAEQQVEEVRKELKRRNPGFDGKMETKIEGGVVTEFRIVTDHVTDIAAIRVFKALRVLECSGTETNFQSNGQLKELTPLEGMNLTALTHLNLAGTKVSDVGLAQFKNCKNLTDLALDRTQVGDAGLAHFKNCKNVRWLNLSGTCVSDAGLAHFKDMPLRVLGIFNTGITDLTPLQDLPLEDIRLTPKNITRGLDILRAMKSLKTIGIDWRQSWPAAEFWQRYDKGEFK